MEGRRLRRPRRRGRKCPPSRASRGTRESKSLGLRESLGPGLGATIDHHKNWDAVGAGAAVKVGGAVKAGAGVEAGAADEVLLHLRQLRAAAPRRAAAGRFARTALRRAGEASGRIQAEGRGAAAAAEAGELHPDSHEV